MPFGHGDQGSGSFVNPYTFVPFAKPDEWPADHPWRAMPVGHDRMAGDRLSGVVEVELTTRSPLLVREAMASQGQGRGTEAEESRFPRRSGRDDQPFVPGSGIAGVVRSLHEGIAGGCLRVFDGDFRPGYRDVAKSREGYWYMARVESVDGDGRPTALTICPQTTWAPAAWLAEVLGGWQAVRTGATVNVLDPGRVTSFGRKVSRLQVSRRHDLERGDGWVLLLTDSGTRKTSKDATYFCAVGRLGSGPRAIAWEGERDEVWQDFLDAVDGTDDVRRARKEGKSWQEETQPPWVNVTANPNRPEVFVGQRIAARPKLFPRHQVVWVRLAERYQDQPGSAGSAPVRVSGIALAQIWRHSGGRYRARDRVTEALLPCQDVADGLCPTCRVFGSAETEGTNTAASTQKAYRGHLRFSDAVLAPDSPRPSMETHLLPPLSAPRPGAGQFYLRNDKVPDPLPMAEPQREWGSSLDGGRVRRLRGRKFYWLTEAFERRPFFRATRNRKDALHTLEEQPAGAKKPMLCRAEAVPAGTRFRYSVRFENLGLAELGGVLAALAPQGVLSLPDGFSGPVGFAVGGGRPLGFGSCTAEVVRLEAHSARSRYTAAKPAKVVSPQEALTAFRTSLPADQRTRVWRALSHILCLDRVSPHHVWWPPAGELPEDGRLVPEHLRSSMAFWQQSRGFRHQGKDRQDDPLLPLPHPGPRPQTLPVVRDDKALRRGNSR
ncbi:hypothetical protein E1265_23930 [Streptomyces sp. 8K308]|uniref:RAMP superfamily CRISPR-associated protein n=1 Tax=Streptomyces sp. 8K308 TaxID=2530388 RepID=UPI001049642A|nr:RAMP superfamily CRISPR-associated protein [Streptomyces sp. 8K308]TDC19426.1 hypothetical protein E1265_23930 [Streptomyces sp. 8K308]